MIEVAQWSFWYGLWTLFVLAVSSGMLMLAYWYLEKRLLPWWYAFFAIVGLFFIRLLVGPMVAFIPFNFIWWWLFTAIYFRLTLPGPMPTWEAGVLSLLQQLYTYLFGLAVAFLGFITSAHPSPIPPSPAVPAQVRLTSPKVTPLNPTSPVANPASAVVRPPPDMQPPPVRPAVTLSGLARTLDPQAKNIPLPNPPINPPPPATIMPGRTPLPPQVPAATLPVPTPAPIQEQQSVNTVIPDSAVTPAPQ